MFREPYNTNYYVTRQEEATLWDWLNHPPQRDDKRLCFLVGTTGSGKSWLLERIRERANETGNFLTFWANGPKDLADENVCQTWVQQVVAQARGAGLSVNFHLSAQISYLVKQVSVQSCSANSAPAHWPLLLVDQADMLPPETLKTVLRRTLLEPFLGEWCTRAIVTLRNETRFKAPTLRKQEIQVSTWSPKQGREQLALRQSNLDLNRQIPGYKAVSPGLNSWFDERLRRSGSLSADDLWEGLRERTKDTAGILLSEEAFNDLILLSERETWSFDEFGEKVGCVNSEAMTRFGVLTKRTILLSQGNRYSLPADLRGLIAAYLQRRAES